MFSRHRAYAAYVHYATRSVTPPMRESSCHRFAAAAGCSVRYEIPKDAQMRADGVRLSPAVYAVLSQA